MSRSYKHTPIVKGGTCDNKFNKRGANKRVRRNKNFSTNGSKYKKLFNQWEIYEYRFMLKDKNADWEHKKAYISK